MKTIIFFLLRVFIIIADVSESNDLSSLESRIYGGEDVPDGEVRFMASFIHDNLYVCSAIMISEKHALTTAYYLHDFFLLWPLPDFNEYSLMLHGGLGPCPDTRLMIERVECLPGYNAMCPSDSFDAAIIMLTDKITSDAGTWIELSDTDVPGIHLKPTALTWGISYDEELVLKKKVVKILSKKKCLRKYNQHVMCVSSDVSFGSENIGTPLIMDGKVIGVLASIFENDNKMFIYTDIVKHRETIHEIMAGNSGNTTMRTPRKFASFDWIENHTL